MIRIAMWFLVGLLALPCWAADHEVVTDPSKIDNILRSIKIADRYMPYPNLADRLSALGLSVNRVIYGSLQRDEIQASQGRYKAGDVLYEFYTNEPTAQTRAVCPIINGFTVLRRGAIWQPESQTANYLLRAKCAAP